MVVLYESSLWYNLDMVFQKGNNLGRIYNTGRKHTLEARRNMGLASLGRVYSKERNKKISESKMGEKHPLWAGDNVSYGALHSWVKRHFPKPEFCVDCKIKKARDLANISHEYKRDLSDWEWLCHKCHMDKDGVTAKLIERNKKRLYKGNKSPMWKGGTPLCLDCGERTGRTYKAIRCRSCYLKLKVRGRRGTYSSNI